MTQSIIRITDDTTRCEVAEAIANLNHTAKREFPKVGTEDQPTPWDRRHRAIDMLLCEWEQAPA